MKKHNKIDKYKDVVCNRLKFHLHYEFCLTKNKETKLRLRANDKKIFRVDGFNLDKAIIIWKSLAKGISVPKIAKEIKKKNQNRIRSIKLILENDLMI